MRITVIGSGYVGLVAAAGFASVGHRVTCVDLDARKVAAINAGQPLLHEDGLVDLVQAGRASGALRATTTLEEGADADAIFICVETPSTPGGGIDLTSVRACAREVGEVLRRRREYCVVAVKSTAVPGTAEDVVAPAIWKESGRTSADIGIASNPEFLREGQAVHDFLHPDRIVIGGIDQRSIDAIAAAYDPFAAPVFRTTPRTAEVIKYASNALWATLVSFANEIATICERTPGVDVEDVLRAVHEDERLTAPGGSPVGAASYLRAGCGFGGSCLPKDVRALVRYARDAGANPELLSAVLHINEARPRALVQLIERAAGTLKQRTFAVLGLAFKPGTDDLRESSAIHVVAGLLDGGARVQAYDPVAQTTARAFWKDPRVAVCTTVAEALTGADAAVVVTAWPEFRTLNWTDLRSRMARPVIVDGRRLLDGATLENAGYQYFCLGRQPLVTPQPDSAPTL